MPGEGRNITAFLQFLREQTPPGEDPCMWGTSFDESLPELTHEQLSAELWEVENQEIKNFWAALFNAAPKK